MRCPLLEPKNQKKRCGGTHFKEHQSHCQKPVRDTRYAQVTARRYGCLKCKRADPVVAVAARRRIRARRFFSCESLGERANPESCHPVAFAKRLPDSAEDRLAVTLSPH